ncbi:MAG: hypothetical protein UR26_C0001G0229 [candidate division TM6 bacterium GW2011_GWF2_32_72]|nr:MAG: hypothetical protein UR26_C0001G0229 [candidate division TM6 bacterium GW2011_GWF2_32_72]
MKIKIFILTLFLTNIISAIENSGKQPLLPKAEKIDTLNTNQEKQLSIIWGRPGIYSKDYKEALEAMNTVLDDLNKIIKEKEALIASPEGIAKSLIPFTKEQYAKSDLKSNNTLCLREIQTIFKKFVDAFKNGDIGETKKPPFFVK